jgi:antitoxin MazE
MKAKVARWGNSLAVRIPMSFAREAGLDEGRPIELRMDGTRIVVERATAPDQELTLDDLLAGMSAERVHDEVDWGAAVGHEAW